MLDNCAVWTAGLFRPAGLLFWRKGIARYRKCVVSWCDSSAEIWHEQNGLHINDNILTHRGRDKMAAINLPDDIFKCIFLNENIWISIKISLKFVPKSPINNIPALVHIMAWCCPGDKPLFEPMVVSLPTHICVTRPQWVKCLLVKENIWVLTDRSSTEVCSRFHKRFLWPYSKWYLKRYIFLLNGK